MILRYFYNRQLAQASYLLGSPSTREALVIDPNRDVQPYLQAARDEGLRIIGVAETHIHADYISGGRELAHRTGTKLYLSGMGNGDLAYDFPPDDPVQYLRAGDHLMIGSIRLDVIHTPGHTPEHIIFQVTESGAPASIGLLAGDCLFAGDVGRPDLLEEAVKIAHSSETAARQQYANLQRFQAMPDHLQVWPGHGAGSTCGKTLGAIPSTTLGYEKLTNPAFQQPDEAAFVTWLREGQPEVPHYFAQMKTVNQRGPALLETLKIPVRMMPDELQQALDDGATIIDARPGERFARGYVPGTINIPGNSQRFSSWTGWFVDYERPVYLIADEAEVPRLVRELHMIGVDDIPGYFTIDAIQHAAARDALRRIEKIDIQTANRQHSDAVMVDVRGHDEHTERHIPASLLLPMGYVIERLEQLPRDRQLIVYCNSGVRSQTVTGLLQNHGYENVLNLVGGIDAWQEAGLPLERGNG
jgi:hydroxyacylglutathione hydrolase